MGVCRGACRLKGDVMKIQRVTEDRAGRVVQCGVCVLHDGVALPEWGGRGVELIHEANPEAWPSLVGQAMFWLFGKGMYER